MLLRKGKDVRMKKRFISVFTASALLVSLIGTLVAGTTVSAEIPDGAVWQEVYFQDFEQGGAKPEFTKSGTSSAWASDSGYGHSFTDADQYDLGDYTLQIKQRKNITTKATMKTDPTDSDTPINGKVPAEKLGKVKISFNIAKLFEAGTATRISIVGDDSNGDKQEQNNILTIKRYNLYYTANGYSAGNWSNSTWHKVDIYVDCENGVYDVVYDGNRILSDIELEYDFTSIYGINFNADKGSSSATSGNYYTYLDNISFSVVSDSVILSADFEYDGDEFVYTLSAKGNASSDNAYMVVAIYNSENELIYTKTDRYDGSSDYMSDSIDSESFGDDAYLKGFIWDMNSLEPLGDSKTYNITEEDLSTEIMKSKNGADATIVFVHDDGTVNTATYLIPEFEKNNLNGTVALMGIKAVEQEDINTWTGILADSHGRLNLASHSYYHDYMGLSDEEHTVYFDGEPTTYPAGYMTQTIANERQRLNGLFPNERILTFVKPGTGTPDGEEQVSEAAKAMIREHYIAMRNTGGGVDKIPPRDVYSVRSLMAKVGEHELSDWQSFLSDAISQKGLLVYLFHSISNKASSLTSSRADVSVLLAEMGEKVAQGKIWSAKFDEAMQYGQEYGANAQAEARAYYRDNYISVSVTDEISRLDTDLAGTFAGREMFDYPLTVKVAVPFDWTYVKLTQNYYGRQEVAKTFTENGVRYVYANVVPDQAAAILTEAASSDYVSAISTDGTQVSGFDPAKFYYKVALPSGTTTAPTITCDKGSAVITQATLSSGEGSGFIKYNDLTYEIHFSVQ